jgi:threonine dehydrogenase-like Zn-dependent dehydrogenase
MKALVWHGKEDVRCDTVSDPAIEEPRDAIIKVTSCAICGSDLHLFHNLIPAMLPGDVLGHESMGEVVEVGSEAARTLKKGDRVVIPFTIYCGDCLQCRRGNYSLCQRSNRKKSLAEKVFGHSTGGLFGYTHLTGGYAGRIPARAVRRHHPSQGAGGDFRREALVPERHPADRLAGGAAMRHRAR